jgi:hypothetical protein
MLVLVTVMLVSCSGGPTGTAPGSQPPTSGSVTGPLTVTSPDGAFTIDIPAGVSVPSAPTITQLDSAQLPFSMADMPPPLGAAYEVGPDGATFSTPATVRMRLPADFPKGALALLASRSSAGAWELLADQRIETGSDGRHLVGTTSHLTTFLTLDSGGVVSTDKELVSAKVGDVFTIYLNLKNAPNELGVSIKVISETAAPGSNIFAHVVKIDLPVTALKGDGTFASFTVQCDNPGETTLVAEWEVEVLGEWPGTGPEPSITRYTFKTEVTVTCVAAPSACVASPGSSTALIDFSTTVTDLVTDLGDAEAFCESIAGLLQPDELGDQFTEDAKPPGLATGANDVVHSLALSAPAGVNWSGAKSACDTTVGGAYVDCGEKALEDGLIAYVALIETLDPQPAHGLVSLGLGLIVDADPTNNWPTDPALPSRVINGADAFVSAYTNPDGTYAPPTYVDLRTNTGRQSNAIVLVAPKWYAFITFDAATQVLPTICQFNNLGQGSEYQACDLPGPATVGEPFQYMTPTVL